MTSIAVAFARSPMTLANLGHDLNAFSKGRFLLGLGSQIQPHITKRFSMPWSHPAARMRELIQAMRAIWACWYQGEKLAFRGEFYTHTLMTPMFTPTNTQYGAPKVLLAAVGPKMTEVAGEVADGMIVHGFTTPKYVHEVTLPALERGLAAAGRSRKGFQLACPVFVVTGRDAKEWEQSRAGVCKQIAFYGSTPAYRGVLELHGWGALQGELNAMSKRGEWDAMGTRITDEILEQFAIVAQPRRGAGPAEAALRQLDRPRARDLRLHRRRAAQEGAGRAAQLGAREPLQLFEALDQRVGEDVEVGHLIGVGGEADAEPAGVAEQADAEALLRLEIHDRVAALHVRAEHVERDLRPRHVRHHQVVGPLRARRRARPARAAWRWSTPRPPPAPRRPSPAATT